MSQDPLVVVSVGNDGKSIRSFDFNTLGLNIASARALKTAFELSLSGCTVETKSQMWRDIKIFAQHLCDREISGSTPFPPTVLNTFRDYLSSSNRSNRHKYVIFTHITRLIVWCTRNLPDAVDEKLNIDPLHTFYVRDENRNIEKRAKLDENKIKAVLAAAYAEIDEIVSRIDSMRAEIKNIASGSSNSSLAILISDLVEFGDGFFPSQKILRTNSSLAKRTVSAGGTILLSSYLYPRARDIFPFYLAILCQCSGNPMSMRLLERDCVKAHPIRSDRRRIVWEKKRSGYEQKADFSEGRKRSAPNLVDIVLRMTEPLVTLSSIQEKKYLFLAYSGSKADVPSWQGMHDQLNRFIERHNLPRFELRDLRRAGAELHRDAAGSLLAAKNRLNHRSVKTTSLYVSQLDYREASDKVIAEAQASLASSVIGGVNAENIEASKQKPIETVFGFICKNPWEGIAKGSAKGSLCTKFTACATCPGAIIPLDDIAVVAKLLKTLEQLKDTYARAINEGWLERFKIFYEPTQRILEQELLPHVNHQVLRSAQKIVSQNQIPYLE